MLKIGICGIGQQGLFYTKLFNGVEVRPGLTLPRPQSGDVTAVCDEDSEKLAQVKAMFPHIECYTDYGEMLDHAGLDAVIVATPHFAHPDMAMQAMARDIHVLVDKPAGVRTDDVARMNAVAMSKPDLVFAMMFNQRTNPLYVKLKALIDDGAIGAIRYTDWTITTWWRPQGYYDMNAWRATWGGEGGGVLINQAPHQIDLWQWICGMPVTVYAKAGYGSQRDIAVEDDVVAMVRYDGGATGVFRTCTHDMMGTDRFEILGNRGKIIVENSERIVVKTLSQPEAEISRGMSRDDVANLFQGTVKVDDFVTETTYEFESEWGREHREVIQNFLNAIRSGEALIAPGCDGIHALAITNAMHLSSWTDREVTLPIDAELYRAELQKRIDLETLAT